MNQVEIMKMYHDEYIKKVGYPMAVKQALEFCKENKWITVSQIAEAQKQGKEAMHKLSSQALMIFLRQKYLQEQK